MAPPPVLDPADDFAAAVVAGLIECRRLGYDFEAAWTETMRVVGRAPSGYGRRGGGNGGESALMFLRRHSEAAWHGLDAQRYCAADCAELVPFGQRYCRDHRYLADDE